MKKRRAIRKLRDFELHHKLLAFITVICLTIILVRLGVLIYTKSTK